MHTHHFVADLKRSAFSDGVNNARILVPKNARHGNLRMSPQIGLEIGPTRRCRHDSQ